MFDSLLVYFVTLICVSVWDGCKDALSYVLAKVKKYELYT